MGKVFTKNTENKKNAILGIRNDGIRENGMCVPTAFTDDSGDTNLLIDWLTVDDIDDGSGIRGMSLTIPNGMTNRTLLRFRMKRIHEIKK